MTKKQPICKSVGSKATSNGSHFTNLRVLDNGSIETVVPKRNAVILDYIENCDDEGNPYTTRIVSIECKDAHMEEFLLEKARELL